MKRESWWYSASNEDRLAQIDGAIELGMTAKQCAMNCGCYELQSKRASNGPVADFALNHGRHFHGDSAAKGKYAGIAWRNGRRVSRRIAKVEDAKQAYLSGEPVDMWSVE